MTRHELDLLAWLAVEQRPEAEAAQEREAAARRRAAGLHQAELVKRRRLALELVAELRRPLIRDRDQTPHNPPRRTP